jgi:hypothetical protein
VMLVCVGYKGCVTQLLSPMLPSAERFLIVQLHIKVTAIVPLTR